MRFLNQKAQSTAEYAIIIAIVIGAAVAMQIYVKRGLQGRMAAGTDQFSLGLTQDAAWNTIGATAALNVKVTPEELPTSPYHQWEPDYAASKSTRTSYSNIGVGLATGGTATRRTYEESQGAVEDFRQTQAP